MRRMRVVIHAHSLWSYDGRYSLDRIARIYGRLGADAVMMTEHDTGFAPERFAAYRATCAASSTPRCHLVPGIEYSSPDNDIHILTWGVGRFLGEHRPVLDTLRDVQAAGGVAVLAHPARRRAWAKVDPAWFGLLHGIELWNRKTDGIAHGPEALALIRQTGLPAFAGHDFHRLRQIWPIWQGVDPPPPGADPEAALVAAIAGGRSTAMAFGRPILDPDGAPRSLHHARAERLRRGLRDLIRRKG